MLLLVLPLSRKDSHRSPRVGQTNSTTENFSRTVEEAQSFATPKTHDGTDSSTTEQAFLEKHSVDPSGVIDGASSEEVTESSQAEVTYPTGAKFAFIMTALGLAILLVALVCVYSYLLEMDFLLRSRHSDRTILSSPPRFLESPIISMLWTMLAGTARRICCATVPFSCRLGNCIPSSPSNGCISLQLSFSRLGP